MQNTKRSLLTSVTALLLCFVMLIGTTFAWFTDQATSANNIIKSGTLDIAMSWSEDNSAWNDTEGAGAKPVFDYRNWEPGYTEVRYIKVQNLGSLAFKYKMAINPTGAVGKLAEVIDVSFDIVTDNASFVAPTADNKQGSLTKVATLKQLIDGDAIVAGGVLLPDGETATNHYSGEIVICVTFHMQETAGNEYQGASIGDAFGINLYATQYDYESDSFDNTYDDNATWPNIENGAASTSIDASNLLLGALTSEVVINGDGISATIPADVKLADGATSLDLTVESATADANISLGDGGSAAGFNVHIEGIAPDNTKPMIVNLGAILSPALSETELKLYHTENGTPTLMTRVNSASDFAIHNQYTYNPATGDVSIYVATFSIFSAVETSADDWDGTADTGWYNDNDTEFTLTTAEQLAGFRDLVDGGNTFAGKTVKLGADIDLEYYNGEKNEDNRVSFNPIGYGYAHSGGKVFMGTFDGQSHTIYSLYQNGWDLGYSYGTQGGGLFASVKNATIKNLAISGANIRMECVDMGIVVGYAQGSCTFDNIVVTNSTIANYNRYTGGVVGEVSGDPSDLSVVGNHTFKNITVDSSVVVSSLWGSFDTSIGGVIGGKWGNANVEMTNVIVAAELDVYSDVTAAYQWYAYRRCGMLIGHTEIDSPKKGLNVHEIEFLTCENVVVYYGNWRNYTYYQFTNQTDEAGDSLWYSNYPWVRAQASPVGNNGAFSNPRYGNPIVNGVAINTKELAEANMTCVEPVTIVFDQLYGGGQGVYGNGKHTGVTIGKISDISTTTIQFQNNGEWKNVKIEYVFAHELDIWTTLVEGLPAATVTNDDTYDVYKFNIPTNAYSIKITGDGKSTSEYKLDALNSNEIYALNIAGTDLVETRKVTFTPDSNWKKASARFALYAFDANNNNTWYNLKAEGSKYVCYLPVEYSQAIFCRMDPNGSNKENNYNNWDNDWNQTKDLTLPTDGSDYSYDTIIYLIPNANWKEANARFAAYFFNDTSGMNTWVSLTDSNKDGIYECIIPLGDWEKMIFCRMSPSSSTNDWNNKWNQTGNLTIPTTSKEYYYVTDNWWDTTGDDCWSEKK